MRVRALAIGGGGGQGDYASSGGGSGYPKLGLFYQGANETLNLVVGGAGQPSTIVIGGEVVLSAAPGLDSDHSAAGEGYSGGGAGGDFVGAYGNITKVKSLVHLSLPFAGSRTDQDLFRDGWRVQRLSRSRYQCLSGRKGIRN